MRLTAAEVADLCDGITQKIRDGLRLNEREWRIWLQHNWNPLHQSLDEISARKVKYALNDGNGYLENMGPNGSGVYFLFDEEELAYIGKATTISQRLWRHFVDSDIRWRDVSWIEMPVECSEEVEHYYIYKFDPPMNTRKLVRGEFMRKLVEGK